MAFGRREEPGSIEDERRALLEQRNAVEELKRELAERVRAVQEREAELNHALAAAGGRRPDMPVVALPAADARPDTGEIERRERAVSDREEAVAARELEIERLARELASAPPPDPDVARLATIEARLAELKDAEKIFLRTREEVAARSEAVAARERLVAQRERELDDREDGKGRWASPELTEMEARLRRLETQAPDERTQGFSGGFRKLEQGARPQRESS